MTYYESAEGEKINTTRVNLELKNHGVIDYEEFYTQVKPDDAGLYDAEKVLAWLGY